MNRRGADSSIDHHTAARDSGGDAIRLALTFIDGPFTEAERQALDALDALLAENERLRAALSRIEHWPFDVGHTPERDLYEIREAAHDALA